VVAIGSHDADGKRQGKFRLFEPKRTRSMRHENLKKTVLSFDEHEFSQMYDKGVARGPKTFVAYTDSFCVAVHDGEHFPRC